MVPHTSATPHLLKTAMEERESPPEEHQAGSDPTTGSRFSGKERATFAAIVLGAVLLCFFTFTRWRQRTAVHPANQDTRITAVRIPSVSTRAVPEEPAAKISADQIHVSAISLGDPPMAIINGRLIGEGEQLTLHPPGAPAGVSLRLRKISDGEVEFSDGAHVIKARLELMPAPKRKR